MRDGNVCARGRLSVALDLSLPRLSRLLVQSSANGDSKKYAGGSEFSNLFDLDSSGQSEVRALRRVRAHRGARTGARASPARVCPARDHSSAKERSRRSSKHLARCVHARRLSAPLADGAHT